MALQRTVAQALQETVAQDKLVLHVWAPQDIEIKQS